MDYCVGLKCQIMAKHVHYLMVYCFNYTGSVACAVGPSEPITKQGTQHVNIVLQCMYQVFEQPNMKGNQS
jgi:hypothetical protein